MTLDFGCCKPGVRRKTTCAAHILCYSSHVLCSSPGLTTLLSNPLQVWFEVSAHTNRVHFHAAPDGGAPLGLSLPLELLALAPGAALPPALLDLLNAFDRRCARRPWRSMAEDITTLNWQQSRASYTARASPYQSTLAVARLPLTHNMQHTNTSPA